MTDRIERELELSASPARVWEALTDPEVLAEWLADEVALELWPGGEATFRTGEVTRTGWVEEVAAPDDTAAPHDTASDPIDRARLTFWWAADGEAASRVEITLTSIGTDSTLLRIVETRPLEVLDLVGIPLPGHGGARYGPALAAA